MTAVLRDPSATLRAYELWVEGWPARSIGERIGRPRGTVVRWAVRFRWPTRRKSGRYLRVRCDECGGIFTAPDVNRIPHVCVKCEKERAA